MVTDEDTKFWRLAEKKAWHYVKVETYEAPAVFHWGMRRADALIKGEKFDEPKPAFDMNKKEYTAIDMFNAFMRGYKVYKELREHAPLMGLYDEEY